MTLPKRVEHRQPRVRRDLASALRSAAGRAGRPVGQGQAQRPAGANATSTPNWPALREQLRRHPAHDLPDREEKARLAERYLRIERDNEQIRQKVAAATNSLARTFDRIVVLLTERGFIDATTDGDPRVTDDGRLLARIYSESDLLVAECLRSGAWEGLDAAELAAVVSSVLYESRGDAPGAPHGADVPTGKLRRALNQTRRLSDRAAGRRAAAPDRAEPRARRRVSSPAIYRWATTGDLTTALAASDASGTGIAVVGGRFRAVVPPGPRPARPGPQRRPDAGAAGGRETRDQRHSTRRRRC